MSIRFFRCLPTVKQGNLAQQIVCALNKLPDKIAFVNIGGCHTSCWKLPYSAVWVNGCLHYQNVDQGKARASHELGQAKARSVNTDCASCKFQLDAWYEVMENRPKFQEKYLI